MTARRRASGASPSESAHPRCILHADMDAFFASVEQRDRPELRGRPVVVGGAGPRGVVAAASYEARVFGVRSAMSSAEAKSRCPELIFVPGDMARYASESRRIFEIFRRYSPLVEGLSLDEAFLDLTGSERLLGPARDAAARLRREVREATGLAVSVGIGPIKMVAKIASGMAKPDGLLEVPRDAMQAFLEPLPVRRIWGVGEVAEQKLLGLGFRTIGDLARADPDSLARLLGDFGVSIGRLARGEDAREVESRREAVSISEENTFDVDVRDRETLERTILAHAEAVGRRLRRQALQARTVVLKWRLGRRAKPGPRGYPVRTRQATLPLATDDGGEIARVACSLLADALAEPVRLIGVGVSGLVEARAGASEADPERQLDLFARPPAADAPNLRLRRSRINAALDEIAERFGDERVQRASQAEIRHATISGQWKKGSRELEERLEDPGIASGPRRLPGERRAAARRRDGGSADQRVAERPSSPTSQR